MRTSFSAVARRRLSVRSISRKGAAILAAAGAALTLAATAPHANASSGLTLTTMATVPPAVQPIRQIPLTGPWGGYSNGKIPANHLCHIGTGDLLRCDAAQQFRLMSDQYMQRFGKPICITVAYRDFATQTALYKAKPNLAAKPGTSNHGWALAVDLCGGIDKFGTVQYRWMMANAAVFGFVHPLWANQAGSRPEPWHWEYGHTAGTRF